MNIRENKTNLELIEEIQERVKNYLLAYNIKTLIIGISGGFDSGFNAAILRPVCDEIGATLIGKYIHIETNKEDEKQRADAIGRAFCHTYEAVDLTSEYLTIADSFMEHEGFIRTEAIKQFDKPFLITLGNIKARLRMIYLYNLASLYKGIVIDNDNKTEHLLGFWTLCGDVGDLTPLASFYKTECYELAKDYLQVLSSQSEKEALQAIIDAVPTDGLGITSSDVEQFGVSSYNEVDAILKRIEVNTNRNDYNETEQKVFDRWIGSMFKRNHPFRVEIE